MDVDIRAVEAYARVKAILARLDGIHTANQERQQQGLANAYGPEEFFAAERDLEAIADSLSAKWTPEQHGQMVADAVNEVRKDGAA